MTPPRPNRLRPPARLLLALAVCALGGCVPFVRRDRYADLEHRMFELVNRHRAARRLPPLVYDPVLAEIARRHSLQMARGKAPFGHRGFMGRARAVRALRPAERISENVAMNVFERGASPVMAVKGLVGSRKHRRNLEGDYALTGVGVARGPDGAFYYTQLFVR
ncbi:MAG TPA: CAP domain-containing protein [Longimicrobium sp.]|jgi:uncharacterized protein YkwD